MHLVQNTSETIKEITIVNEAGQRDTIFIQPMGRAKIPDGFVVPSNKLQLDPTVKLVDLSTGRPVDFRTLAAEGK